MTRCDCNIGWCQKQIQKAQKEGRNIVCSEFSLPRLYEGSDLIGDGPKIRTRKKLNEFRKTCLRKLRKGMQQPSKKSRHKFLYWHLHPESFVWNGVSKDWKVGKDRTVSSTKITPPPAKTKAKWNNHHWVLDLASTVTSATKRNLKCIDLSVSSPSGGIPKKPKSNAEHRLSAAKAQLLQGNLESAVSNVEMLLEQGKANTSCAYEKKIKEIDDKLQKMDSELQKKDSELQKKDSENQNLIEENQALKCKLKKANREKRAKVKKKQGDIESEENKEDISQLKFTALTWKKMVNSKKLMKSLRVLTGFKDQKDFENFVTLFILLAGADKWTLSGATEDDSSTNNEGQNDTWERPAGHDYDNFKADLYKTCGRSKVTVADKFLVMLTILRNGITLDFAAVMFGMSQSSVQRIFVAFLCGVANVIRSEKLLEVNKEQLEAMSSETLNEAFGVKCVSYIIDGAEIVIETPYDKDAQKALFSAYKHNNTIKFLVGLNTGGMVSFISQAFVGSISDNNITKDSGFYDKCVHPGHAIMADKRKAPRRSFHQSHIVKAISLRLRRTRGHP